MVKPGYDYRRRRDRQGRASRCSDGPRLHHHNHAIDEATAPELPPIGPGLGAGLPRISFGVLKAFHAESDIVEPIDVLKALEAADPTLYGELMALAPIAGERGGRPAIDGFIIGALTSWRLLARQAQADALDPEVRP